MQIHSDVLIKIQILKADGVQKRTPNDGSFQERKSCLNDFMRCYGV